MKFEEIKSGEMMKGDIEISLHGQRINLLFQDGKKMLCCHNSRIYTIEIDKKAFLIDSEYLATRKISK